MNTKIIYKDVSTTAKDNSTVVATDKQPFVDLNELKESNLTFPLFSTCEPGFVKLDGTFEDMPTNLTNENIGLWSLSMTNENGDFAQAPILEINFSGYQKSVGISFSFHPITNDYCSYLNIKWYQDGILLADEDFEPNSGNYFCQKNVENYNKLIIEFYKTNNPYRFLKLQEIEYGVVRTFEGDELSGVEIFEEVSLTSEELTISTLNFTLQNVENIEFIFQKKQPLSVRHNNALIGTFFIEHSKRVGKISFDIEAIDCVGLLDKTTFAGGTYNNSLASTVIQSVMGKIPYVLDEELGSKRLTGTLKRCTCREALKEILFAIGGIATASRNSKINISKLQAEVKSNFTEEQVYLGSNFETNPEITGIRLTLNNGAIIERLNPVITEDTFENILEFENVFANTSNANEILDRLYNYYITERYKVSDVEIRFINEKVGDVITYETEYLGNKKGRIMSMSYNLNGNILLSSSQIKELEV